MQIGYAVEVDRKQNKYNGKDFAIQLNEMQSFFLCKREMKIKKRVSIANKI